MLIFCLDKAATGIEIVGEMETNRMKNEVDGWLTPFLVKNSVHPGESPRDTPHGYFSLTIFGYPGKRCVRVGI